MTATELRLVLADALDGASERLRAGLVAAGEPEGSSSVTPPLRQPLDGVLEAVLTPNDVARILGISRGRTYESIRAGEIPAVWIGRRMLVPTEALRGWLMRPGAHETPARLS